MIWTKTEAGRAEIQAKALIKERAQRNLLVLIDGHKSEEMLLGAITGISPDDFTWLESLGLIEPLSEPESRPARASTPAAVAAAPASAPPPAPPTDYAHFTEALTQMISKELGLRGLPLTLALEKASTPQELRDVAERVLAKLQERKGEAAAHAARRALFGG